jgi:hypothetical protein
MPNSTRAFGLAVASLLLVTVFATPAQADITAFLGTSRNPSSHLVRGAAFGMGLLVVGFEIEGALHTENTLKGVPGLKTGMGNIVVQTPTGRTQFYGTAGGGVYRETLGTISETHVATNIGGGIKVGLAGPLRLRADFRIINLRGTPRYATVQRFYVGANIKF